MIQPIRLTQPAGYGLSWTGKGRIGRHAAYVDAVLSMMSGDLTLTVEINKRRGSAAFMEMRDNNGWIGHVLLWRVTVIPDNLGDPRDGPVSLEAMFYELPRGDIASGQSTAMPALSDESMPALEKKVA